MRHVLTCGLRVRLLAVLALGSGCGDGADGPLAAGNAAECKSVAPPSGPTVPDACSAPDQDGMRVCGELSCDYCSGKRWFSCWLPADVPTADPAPATTCPLNGVAQAVSPYLCGQLAAVQGPVDHEGYCCYLLTAERPPSGRPFVVSGEHRVAALRRSDEWMSSFDGAAEELDSITARSLATAWLDDAQLEHASIASFARLTLELLAHGAPPSLVTASQEASLDEIRHAEACFALGSRFAGASFGPGPLDLGGAELERDLVRLAVATFEEGCVGETVAALAAGEACHLASDPSVVQVLAGIAADEARHAELGWRIVAWAIERGGDAVARAVRRSFEQLVARLGTVEAPELDDAIDRAALRRFGRLTPAELSELRMQCFTQVIAPCFEALEKRSAKRSAESVACRVAPATSPTIERSSS